ncbi:MAG TPA: plastocyanin/azurin family copper-binding protein [Steroidobacteraceae bacterium]|nr:plastocyanin/azurin family copper-binding protein [Steroidobacteraceae bacterium]
MNRIIARTLALVVCGWTAGVLGSASAGEDALGSQPASGAPVIVKISNFTFEPATIKVSPGTQIKWINEDDVPHTVTGTDPKSPMHSAALDTDDSYAVVMGDAGTFKYFCAVHPHMVGTVIVE